MDTLSDSAIVHVVKQLSPRRRFNVQILSN